MFTVQETNAVLANNSRLSEAVGSALLCTELDSEHHELAGECAAYLHVSGWLKEQQEIYGGDLREATDDAIEELQCAGILTIEFLSWFFIRFVIAPYIGALVREWLFGGEYGQAGAIGA